MRYNLFLDDTDFIIVRNFDDFKKIIIQNSLPQFISFDNDLGLDEHNNIASDGYEAAKWLVYESGLDLKKLKFNVHSANPVAAVQIESLLNNYLQHLKQQPGN